MFLTNVISSTSARVILSLAIMLISGFLSSRITKKLRMPNVTGYILSGILIGPYLLKLIPIEIINNAEFLTDIALAFISFGVGEYFKLSDLKKSGAKIFVLTFFESLFAALLISIVMYFGFHLPLSFCLLLAAIGSATAPASTIMTIRQYNAKGSFVTTLLQVVALDDGVALLAFSACTAVITLLDAQQALTVFTVTLPMLLTILTLILGGIAGYILRLLITKKQSVEKQLIISCGLIFLVTGLCASLDVSPLLACMIMGAVYINTGGQTNLFVSIGKSTSVILLLFFVLSGMRLDVTMLSTAGIIGLAYFIVRIVGKYIGAYLGAVVTNAPKNIRNFMGLALIPQAGVSIGLALLGQRLLPPEAGAMLSTIILSSGVLYEVIGPVCAKLSLFLSGSIEVPANIKK